LRLGPISLDGEDRETLPLDQVFEQAVLHLKEFGGAVARLAESDKLRVANDLVEKFDILNRFTSTSMDAISSSPPHRTRPFAC